MDVLAAWVLYPAVALAVAAGLGLLVERAAGERLPGVLVLPVGMAALLAVTQLPTTWDATAEATVPLTVVLALAGLALGAPTLRDRRPDRWAAGAAFAVFAVCAAPVVLSGSATFAGYTVLGDTSIHFIGADALLSYGRDFGALPPSSYEYSLQAYFGLNGYPSGGPVAAGVLTRLAGQDVAWTFQPFLSLLVALQVPALWSLVAPLLPSRPLRAVVTAVAAMPALVVAYGLQGSVKEVGTVFAVVVVAALAADYARGRIGSFRRAIPLAVAAAGGIAVVGVAALIWIAPLCAAALVAVLWSHPAARWRPALWHVAAFLAICAVLSLQSALELGSYVDVAGAVVTSQAEVGNLLRPLDLVQALGIWFSGDYRLPPDDLETETYVLCGVALVSVVLGLPWLWRRRAAGIGLFVAVSVLGWAYVTLRGSPWADGKALMIVSPAVVLVAMLGAVGLREVRRVEGTLLVAALAGAVLVSNALAYHDVSLAPRDRLNELAEIGDRIEDRGPSLYTEFEEFGKHFLRESAPEGSAEAWQRRLHDARDRSGTTPGFGIAADLDRYQLPYYRHFRTIVLRRGYFGSLPPSSYRRTSAGRYYDVWERDPQAPRVLAHAPFGAGRNPSAAADCPRVRRLGRRAREAGAELAFVAREVAPVVSPATGDRSPKWFADPSDQLVLRVRGQGRARLPIGVPRAGRYTVWIEGSFGRGHEVLIDGRPAGKVEYELNNRLSANHAATVELSAGDHVLELRSPGGDPRPGNGGYNRLLGPVALAPEDPGDARVERIPASRWRELCGRAVDWIEIVEPS